MGYWIQGLSSKHAFLSLWHSPSLRITINSPLWALPTSACWNFKQPIDVRTNCLTSSLFYMKFILKFGTYARNLTWGNFNLLALISYEYSAVLGKNLGQVRIIYWLGLYLVADHINKILMLIYSANVFYSFSAFENTIIAKKNGPRETWHKVT